MVFQFERPLAGKRIVVTRAPEQAEELITALESLGAEIVLLPTIAFAEAQDSAPLDRAVSDLDKFDWVIFTSRNAVKYLSKRLQALQIPLDRMNQLLLTPEVAVIGSATSEEALSAGFLPQYEAVESRGEELARELLENVRGKRVLLPRSDLANPALPQCLRDAGAEVVEVVAYHTIVPPLDMEVLEAIRKGAIDVIIFFSPSAYRNLAEKIGLETLRRQSSKIVFASIGPTTSHALRQDGLEVGIEAPSASAEELCEAAAAYFSQRTGLGAMNQ